MYYFILALFFFLILLSFIFGILFLFFPNVVRRINTWTNKMVLQTEEVLFSHRVLVGLFFLSSCVVLIYMLYSQLARS